MSLKIETREATYSLSCVCCGERVRTCERYIQVINTTTGKNVRGERYCLHCEEEAKENNDISNDEPDFGSGERLREAYGAYQAAGCTSAFFDDLNGGYIG